MAEQENSIWYSGGATMEKEHCLSGEFDELPAIWVEGYHRPTWLVHGDTLKIPRHLILLPTLENKL
jgi:hypothetical protein